MLALRYCYTIINVIYSWRELFILCVLVVIIATIATRVMLHVVGNDLYPVFAYSACMVEAACNPLTTILLLHVIRTQVSLLQSIVIDCSFYLQFRGVIYV
jgi:hypothetical protein